MTAATKFGETPGDEIDMDRVVVDQEYRRRVINRLRQVRLAAEAQRLEATGRIETWQGEED